MARRWFTRTSGAGLLILATVLIGPGNAGATSGGGWDAVGTGGTATSASLNGPVNALATGPSAITLYVGGSFTNAGGVAGADRIAIWTTQNTWLAVSSATSQISNGAVNAIAVDGST